MGPYAHRQRLPVGLVTRGLCLVLERLARWPGPIMELHLPGLAARWDQPRGGDHKLIGGYAVVHLQRKRCHVQRRR